MKKQPKQKRLRTREDKAVEYYTNPTSETYKNWSESYLKAGYSNAKGWIRNAAKVRSKPHIKAAIMENQAKNEEKSDITREYLINKLQSILIQPENQAVMVSASREIADLCGFHRELAPNAEKEAKRREHIDLQQRKISEKMAKELTDEAASEPNTIKLRAG